MGNPTPQVPQYSPGILSLLPLYYVGWADNLLSPGEIQLIRNKIREMTFLDKKDIKLLLQWGDPSNPPSRNLFRQWKKIIDQAAEEVPEDSKRSLADLGLEMAQRNAPKSDLLYWRSPDTLNALKELESALGVLNQNNKQSIFNKWRIDRLLEESGTKAGFNIKEMQKMLDDDYFEIRQKMRILLSDPIFKLEAFRDKENYRTKVLEWCKLLAGQGFGALPYPKTYGGKASMGDYIAVFEMLGYHDNSLTIKFGVQFGLFGGSVQFLGTKKHHDQYLRKIGSLKLPGCFAMTETGHGSNVRDLETTAHYDQQTDEFVIHSPTKDAGKEYIGNALHGKMATVFAQLIVKGENHGVHAILVPLRNDDGILMQGITIEDCGYKLGLNGVDNGRIWFNQVRVPRENLLNRFGNVDEHGNYSSPIKNPSRRFFTMLGTLVGGRVSVPRAGLSAAKAGLAIAIKYSLKRRQFAPKEGEPETILLDYPSHQRRLMPLLAKAYALDFALTYLTKRYVNRSEVDIREIETLAAGMKSYATWFTTKTLQECREACGGKGYLWENRFADLKADTDIFTTFEGDNTVLMQLVAKGLLSEFKQEFHHDGFRAVMRLVLSKVSTSVTEQNPIATRKTDPEHLLDSEFHLDAFRYRDRELLHNVSSRMRGLLRIGFEPQKAFLRCQTHLLALADAFVERLVLEQFITAIDKCTDEGVERMLRKLCQLYALSTIEEHKGWYLEENYMQPVKTKAIRRLVNKLCKEVRQEAGYLVEAFAIPESCLSAPIAV